MPQGLLRKTDGSGSEAAAFFVADTGGQVYNPRGFAPGAAIGLGSVDATAAIQAAITAAQSAAQRGRVYLPPGRYLLSGSGSELLLATKAVQICGAGMRSTELVVASSVPATTDVIRYAPDAGEGHGFEIRDLRITTQSGTPARHGINIDVSTAARIAREILIERCWIDTLGGRVIETSNSFLDAEGNPTYNVNGIFRLTIRNNWVSGGIRLINAGDSITIYDNIITGPNWGIEADLVSGAALLIIQNNNMSSHEGAIWVKRGIHTLILNNWIETITTFNGNKLIYLQGAAGAPLWMPEIRHNMMGVLRNDQIHAPGQNWIADAVYLDYVKKANVSYNTFTLLDAASRGMYATANAVNVEGLDTNVVSAGAGQLSGSAGARTKAYRTRMAAARNDSLGIGNTIAETTFNRTITLGNNGFAVGDVIRLRAGGVYSTDAAGTVNLTIRAKVGASLIGEATVTLPASAASKGWWLDTQLTIRALGSTGTFRPGGGMIAFQDGTPNGASLTNFGGAAKAINTTVDQTVQITAQWSAARLNDLITMFSFTVEHVPTVAGT